MENGFKILIDKKPEYHFGVDIRIALFRDGQLYIAEPIQLQFKKHEHGERIGPTLELDDYQGTQFLDALKEALNDHQGIKADVIEGELKATKEHLKDMRLLVFHELGIKEAFQPTVNVEFPRR